MSRKYLIFMHEPIVVGVKYDNVAKSSGLRFAGIQDISSILGNSNLTLNIFLSDDLHLMSNFYVLTTNISFILQILSVEYSETPSASIYRMRASSTPLQCSLPSVLSTIS